MINNRLIHFIRKTSFDTALNNNEIQNDAIVFIKETSEI